MEPCTSTKGTPGDGRSLGLLVAFSVALATPSVALARQESRQPVCRSSASRLPSTLPSRRSIPYGARDLAGYLTTLGGHQVSVRAKAVSPASGETVIAVGERMVAAYGGAALDGLGPEGFCSDQAERQGHAAARRRTDTTGHQRRPRHAAPAHQGGPGVLYLDGRRTDARHEHPVRRHSPERRPPTILSLSI